MKAAKRGDISPFLVMEAFREAQEVARTGVDVIHLSLGQPGRTPPRRVLERLAERVLNEPLGYTDAAGLYELRQRISDHYRDAEGVVVAPESIFVTIGSSTGFLLSMLAAFDAGDRVALATPCYPAYPNMLRALHLEPVLLPSTLEDNYQPTVEMLQALPQLPQGLVIASPSNPAGTVIGHKEMEKLVRFCEENAIRLISDEIYHGVTFGKTEAVSALAFSRQMIVVNSFSKYYLMPGWRLGWAVVPDELRRSFASLASSFYISPPAMSQYAALEVFDCIAELDDAVDTYERNREILLEALPRLGFTELSPADGAFYIYANCSRITNDSQALCSKLLREAYVCAVPGLDFDRERGGSYLRFSFAGETSDVLKAVERMERCLKA